MASVLANGTQGGQTVVLKGVDPETCMIVFKNHWAQVTVLHIVFTNRTFYSLNITDSLHFLLLQLNNAVICVVLHVLRCSYSRSSPGQHSGASLVS